MADTEEYLKLMEEKNRILKRLEAKRRSRKQREAESREAGFNLHFRGANDPAGKSHPAGSQARGGKVKKLARKASSLKRPKPVPDTSLTRKRSKAALKESGSSTSVPKPQRRAWIKDSVTIKGQNGKTAVAQPAQSGQRNPSASSASRKAALAKVSAKVASQKAAASAKLRRNTAMEPPVALNDSAEGGYEDDFDSFVQDSPQKLRNIKRGGPASPAREIEEDLLTDVSHVESIHSEAGAILQQPEEELDLVHENESFRSPLPISTKRKETHLQASPPPPPTLSPEPDSPLGKSRGRSRSGKQESADERVRGDAFVRLSNTLSRSFDKASVESLLRRFQLLDKGKRGYLLQVLDALEHGDAQANPQQLIEILATPRHTEEQERGFEEKDNEETKKCLEKPVVKVKEAKPSHKSKKHSKKEKKDKKEKKHSKKRDSKKEKERQRHEEKVNQEERPADRVVLSRPPSQASGFPHLVGTEAGKPTAVARQLPLMQLSSSSAPSHRQLSEPASTASRDQTYSPNKRKREKKLSLKKAPDRQVDEKNMLQIRPVAAVDSEQHGKRPFLLLRVFSNWGHRRKVGLTKLEVFDAQGQRLSLKPEDIALVTRPGGASSASAGRSRLCRLVDGGSPHTAKERDMWQTVHTFPSDSGAKGRAHKQRPEPLELSLSLPRNSQPSHLRVWNFNQSAKDSLKGVKDVEVLLNGEKAFKGTIDKAAGMPPMSEMGRMGRRGEVGGWAKKEAESAYTFVPLTEAAALQRRSRHNKATRRTPAKPPLKLLPTVQPAPSAGNSPDSTNRGLALSSRAALASLAPPKQASAPAPAAAPLRGLGGGAAGAAGAAIASGAGLSSLGGLGGLSGRSKAMDPEQDDVLRQLRRPSHSKEGGSFVLGHQPLPPRNLDAAKQFQKQEEQEARNKAAEDAEQTERAEEARLLEPQVDLAASFEQLAIFQRTNRGRLPSSSSPGDLPTEAPPVSPKSPRKRKGSSQKKPASPSSKAAIAAADAALRPPRPPSSPNKARRSPRRPSPAKSPRKQPKGAGGGSKTSFSLAKAAGGAGSSPRRGSTPRKKVSSPSSASAKRAGAPNSPSCRSSSPKKTSTVRKSFDFSGADTSRAAKAAGGSKGSPRSKAGSSPRASLSSKRSPAKGGGKASPSPRQAECSRQRREAAVGQAAVSADLEELLAELDATPLSASPSPKPAASSTSPSSKAKKRAANKGSKAKATKHNTANSPRKSPVPAGGDGEEDLEALLQEFGVDPPGSTAGTGAAPGASPGAGVGAGKRAGASRAGSPLQPPTLPSGRVLVLTLLSTWGDPHYIGLCGLEIFDGQGRLLRFPRATIAKNIIAHPADINVLPEVSNDPRVVGNLLDGVNCTCDDMHVWLAPFSEGKRHIIVVDLGKKMSISLIRIWNYNKSRIHSERGARDVEVSLDKQTVFRGEVRKAPGNVPEAADCAENILFTLEAPLLDRLDRALHRQLRLIENDEGQAEGAEAAEERPLTAGGNGGGGGGQAVSLISLAAARQGVEPRAFDLGATINFSLLRPSTAIADRNPRQPADADRGAASLSARTHKACPSSAIICSPPASAAALLQGASTVVGRVVRVYVGSTWGDPHFAGLNGLQLLSAGGEVVPLTVAMLDANPRDINSVPGHSGDNRTLDKLIDGVNVTCDDNHMWLAPFVRHDSPAAAAAAVSSSGDSGLPAQWLQVTLPRPTALIGLRVWNYSKSVDDTQRGIKWVKLHVDGKDVSPPCGFLLRKSPGHASYDFGQSVFFHLAAPPAAPRPQRFRPFDAALPQTPCGHSFRFLLHSTWGDRHYIGLNGLQILSFQGDTIDVPPACLTAVPADVNSASTAITSDRRVAANLVDGANDTFDDVHMWLAPFHSSSKGLPTNALHVVFDAPVCIAAVKLWNYAKTPTRGVRHLQIFLDDNIIFDGELQPAPTAKQLSATRHKSFGQSILFTGNPQVLDQEAASVRKDTSEQQVTLIDEKRVRYKPQHPFLEV